MRLATTSSPALQRFAAITAVAAGVAGVLAGCGGGEETCTTIGCQSGAPEGNGGASGADGAAASTSGGTGGSTSGGFFPDQGGAGAGATGGGLGDDEACREVEFTATSSPVNVHVLVDRSVSMLDPADPGVAGSPTRWDAVTRALQAFVSSAEAADARVGLQFFGLQNAADDCGVEKYVTPTVPIGPLAQNRAALLDAIATTQPGSLTPTAPAVEGALQYALQVAQAPENEGIPTVLILATDGMPSECGPVGPDGMRTQGLSNVLESLERYSTPLLDASGNVSQPPILTYLIGTRELENNAQVLAAAGGGQAFLVDAAAPGTNLEARFLDALLSIVVKPLDCEIDVPQTASDTGEVVDFEKVRVQFTGAASGTTTEFPRVMSPGACGNNSAWFYDDNLAPQKILFCRSACDGLGAGDLKLELGCSPRIIVQ